MMRRLLVKNLGPLKYADVNLKRINVVIGPQSSGKSCVLKTASYCTWVEKRIQLSQSHDYFAKKGQFIRILETFHKIKGYIQPDTCIEYESDAMIFSYDQRSEEFKFEWKDGRWQYVTPKIAYIPAERNMVGAITNWFEISLPDDNIRNFMSDWQRARTDLSADLKILNLGVAYHYDKVLDKDKVILTDGRQLDFTNTSSGLQSLIPAAVVLNYLYNTRFASEKENSILRQNENSQLARCLYSVFYKDRSTKQQGGQATGISAFAKVDSATKHETHTKSAFISPGTFVRLGGITFSFDSEEDMERCRRVYDRFTKQSVTEIFMEEPEQNLFAPTQGIFATHLINASLGEHGGTLFVSTHSPYMLSSILERSDIADCLGVFYMKEADNATYTVVTADDDDIQRLYDLDSDAFFNLV